MYSHLKPWKVTISVLTDSVSGKGLHCFSNSFFSYFLIGVDKNITLWSPYKSNMSEYKYALQDIFTFFKHFPTLIINIHKR